MKTVLIIIFIIIMVVFFVYAPNNIALNKFAPNKFETFTSNPDALLISYTNYLYTVNTQEIFINNIFNKPSVFSNATIDGISKNYIVNDMIYIDHFNYNYFDYKILIGNKSINVYLDKNRTHQLQLFYYYTGEKPGIVRFYESDGSMQNTKKKHKAINSFVLINNSDGGVGTNINYIFANDVLEGRPNVNYKSIKFMDIKNGSKPPATDIQVHNEPYAPLYLGPNAKMSMSAIECNLSLSENSDLASSINGTSSCTIINNNVPARPIAPIYNSPIPSKITPVLPPITVPAPTVRPMYPSLVPAPTISPVYPALVPSPTISPVYPALVPAPTVAPTAPTVPCTYGSWTPSGSATVTGCKTGTQAISRTATDGGKGDCTGPISSTVPVGVTDTSQCSTCNYGAWTPSGGATVTGCKTGSQAISRTATDGGKGDCTAPVSSTVPVGLSDTSQCSTCNYSAWAPSGSATVTGCKTGIQTIGRTATDGGKGDCTGPISSTVPVGLTDTSQCPTCNYSDWTPSGSATVTGCKTGIQTISRTATDGGRGDCTAPITSSVPVGITDITKCAPVITGSYNVTTVGTNNIITFWGNGTLKLSNNTTVETLIVGGGGAGGSQLLACGGGGGGGVGTGTLSLIGGTNYTIDVGKGGIASDNTSINSTSGDNSRIYDNTQTINEIAYGGGAGGARIATMTGGINGGSGGGGSGWQTGGTKVVGSGKLTYYGNNGGRGGQYAAGGGGGGALAAGSEAPDFNQNGGAGGKGYTWPITNNVYGSGGGGGGMGEPANKGGEGGTNADYGGTTLINPFSGGIIGTGGGGGGAGRNGGSGSNGGSGVVIFAIPISQYPASLFSPGVATPAPPTPPPPPSTADASVCYYSFDTASINGLQVLNLITNKYDATLTTAGLIDTTNQNNGTGCLALTGDSSKYFNLPPITTGTNGLSISMWFKIPNSFVQDANHQLWLLDMTTTSQTDNIIIQVRRDNNLEVDVFNNGKQYYNVFRTSPLVYDNTWKHLVWTISPSGQWNVYINGAKLTSSEGTSVYPTPMTRTRCRVGRTEWGSFIDGFLGYIDDYRIFNKELSPSEIGILSVANINVSSADITGISSDNYNVIAFTTPNNKNANFTVQNATSVNIFMVGGGGNGGGGGGSGGGAGGVVHQTVTLQKGTYTVNVGNRADNANQLGSDRTTWIKDSNGNVLYIANTGGDGNGFNPGSGRPGNGGSGGGAAWAGSQNAGSPGIQIRSYTGSTIYSAGTGNTANSNIANPGGKGLLNIDTLTNNQNIGNGGGGGAGTPGGDATLIQAIGGNDQDGYPIGPIKGGKGGDGILCTLPGIKNFTYNGKNWGQLYWAGGGGAGFSGYTYDRTKTFDYNSPTKSADGGKGGGGGGQGPWKVGITSGGTQTSTNCFAGDGDKNGLNPGGTYQFYGSNNAGPGGSTGDGGNHGGNGGDNTGGGGGGGYDSGGGGSGGSGIVIISFAK